MKKSKIAILSIVALTATLVIGGTIMTVQNKSLFTDGIFDFRSSKEKQLAYLKEHEEEIKEFVKSQNSKIESVQIEWAQPQWDQIGNGTPQGGGDIVQVYGGFNNIEESDWSVMFELEKEKVIFDSMTLSGPLRVGGRGFDE